MSCDKVPWFLCLQPGGMHLELQNMRWEPAYNLFINVQRNWRSGAATVAESQPETDELLAGAAAIQEGCPALPHT